MMDDLPAPNADATKPQKGPRFAAGPRVDDYQAWGVWDRRLKVWAERPCYIREAAERLAKTMVKVHAAGLADGEASATTRAKGLPFAAAPSDKGPEAWGVFDRRDERWIEPTVYGQHWAEELAMILNETYAAGLAEGAIAKARQRPPRGAGC